MPSVFSRRFFFQSRDAKSAGKFGLQVGQRAILMPHQHHQVINQVANFADKMLAAGLAGFAGGLDHLGRLLR